MQNAITLVENLKKLVVTERKITAEIIEHIQMIDLQRIYLKMGFANLYAFLTEYIGYTAAAAQRRIEAARLLTSVPEVKEDLKSGTLNLSQVSLVAQSIRLKQKEAPTVHFNSSDKKHLLESVKGLSLESSQKVISQTLDLEVRSYEKHKVQSDESVRIEMTLTKEQSELLKKIKNLVSHVNPNASTAEVFEYLANDYLKRKDPARLVREKSIGSKNVGQAEQILVLNSTSATEVISSYNVIKDSKYARKNEIIKFEQEANTAKCSTQQNHSSSKTRKAISASIKRAVWKRDQGKCQQFNPTTGRVCGSQHLIELDHIKRHSHGGSDSAHNLRLLCKAHNLWRR